MHKIVHDGPIIFYVSREREEREREREREMIYMRHYHVIVWYLISRPSIGILSTQPITNYNHRAFFC